ncbi:MAG: NAD(P)-dependent oxidoreductase, partial [Sphingomonadaceae bacterium]|nr:NAD(P)-dependent oxidoreductase [Sphingomonadaceae bacterium]
MRIAVTGAGGFVGRHLVSQLIADGHTVRGLDSHPGSIPQGAEAVAGDLGDPAMRHYLLAGDFDALI